MPADLITHSDRFVLVDAQVAHSRLLPRHRARAEPVCWATPSGSRPGLSSDARLRSTAQPRDAAARLVQPTLAAAAAERRARLVVRPRHRETAGSRATTFSDGRKRIPASASASIVVSLYESPAATTSKLSSLSGRHGLTLSVAQAQRGRATCPAASTTSELQKEQARDGRGCAINGAANS